MVESYDLGISLYRASNNDIENHPNATQQDANWQQLSLDENGEVVPTNC